MVFCCQTVYHKYGEIGWIILRIPYYDDVYNYLLGFTNNKNCAKDKKWIVYVLIRKNDKYDTQRKECRVMEWFVFD